MAKFKKGDVVYSWNYEDLRDAPWNKNEHDAKGEFIDFGPFNELVVLEITQEAYIVKSLNNVDNTEYVFPKDSDKCGLVKNYYDLDQIEENKTKELYITILGGI